MSRKAKYYYLQARVGFAIAIGAWLLAAIFGIGAITGKSIEIATFALVSIVAGAFALSRSRWFRERADKLAQQPYWEEQK